VVLVKIPVFWEITPSELVNGNYVLEQLTAFPFTVYIVRSRVYVMKGSCEMNVRSRKWTFM
jgi:hypothetical protein